MKIAFPVLTLLIISLLAPPLSIGNPYSVRDDEECAINLDICHRYPAYQYQAQIAINMNMFDLLSFDYLSMFSEDVKPLNIDPISEPIDPPPKMNLSASV